MRKTFIHGFYKRKIANHFGNILRVTTQDGNVLWTNCFEVAKKHALSHQTKVETQMSLF